LAVAANNANRIHPEKCWTGSAGNAMPGSTAGNYMYSGKGISIVKAGDSRIILEESIFSPSSIATWRDLWRTDLAFIFVSEPSELYNPPVCIAIATLSNIPYFPSFQNHPNMSIATFETSVSYTVLPCVPRSIAALASTMRQVLLCNQL